MDLPAIMFPFATDTTPRYLRYYSYLTLLPSFELRLGGEAGLPPRPLDLCYQSGPQVFPGFEPGRDVTDPRMAQEVTLSLSLATAVTLAALLFTALLPHI